MTTSGDDPGAHLERVRAHESRLRSLSDTGILGESYVEQLCGVLADTARSLGTDYAELGGQRSAADPDTYVLLCALPNGRRAPAAVGSSRLYGSQPRMISDTAEDEELAADRIVRRLNLRSVLLWPFKAEDRYYVLTLGWRKPRQTAMDEEEREYFEFLISLLSRLLKAQEQQAEMLKRASTDPLTGLANRTAVLEHLSRQIHAAERELRQIALLYIDLNNFKRINDEYGHVVGDVTLQHVASRVQSVMRKNEVCGRLGGDEFCAVVCAFNDEDGLDLIAERILQTFGEPLTVDDRLRIELAASIGIAVYPRDGTTAEQLLARADRAMYEVKRERRAAFAFASPQLRKTILPKIRINSASFHQEFVLCYQPIVSARTGRTIAAEVLPRWLQRDAMSPPEVFLRAAQDQGAMNELDALVLQKAHERISAAVQPSHITLHVNVFEANEELLKTPLSRHLPVALEFTAEQIAHEPEKYRRFISACQEQGFQVGVSHFGRGGIPARELLSLHVDFVKVGRSEWLSPLVEYAHQLGCTVIAETIETANERRWISTTGVDGLQGFAIATPLAEQDFLTWLKRNRNATNAAYA